MMTNTLSLFDILRKALCTTKKIIVQLTNCPNFIQENDNIRSRLYWTRVQYCGGTDKSEKATY